MTTELGIAPPAPKISPEDVARVVGILRAHGGWMSAREIATEIGKLGGPTRDWDRRVRAIASAARPQIVSFAGAPGYRLIEFCTMDEIDHCLSAWHAVGVDAFKTEVCYLRAYHSRFRGEQTPKTEAAA